jgi:hypothetical protein
LRKRFLCFFAVVTKLEVVSMKKLYVLHGLKLRRAICNMQWTIENSQFTLDYLAHCELPARFHHSPLTIHFPYLRPFIKAA